MGDNPAVPPSEAHHDRTPLGLVISRMHGPFTSTVAANRLFIAAAASGICTSWALGLPCPARRLTGYDCPGCGASRALWNLSSGRPLAALQHNAVFVLILVGLLLVGVFGLLGIDTQRLQARIVSRSSRKASLGVVIIWTVLRNLPMLQFMSSTAPA
jgi:hypothetical protein